MKKKLLTYTVLQPKRVIFLLHCLGSILLAKHTFVIIYPFQLLTLNYRLQELFKAKIPIESA